MSMCGSMALVRLPARLQQGSGTSAEAKAIQDALFAQQVEVPVKALGGVLYVRVSCAVYNELQDYRKLEEAVAALRGEP